MVTSITEFDVRSNEKGRSLTFSPYDKFIYALRAKESKRQVPRRLQMFLDFINIKSSSIEENCNLFEYICREGGRSQLENDLLIFFTVQNRRAERVNQS